MKSVWIEFATGDERKITKIEGYLAERFDQDIDVGQHEGRTFFRVPETDIDLLRNLIGRRAFHVRRELGGRMLTAKLNQHRPDFSHKAQLVPTLEQGVLARGAQRTQSVLPFKRPRH